MDTRTSHGIEKSDATGPFKLTLRHIHGRGQLGLIRNRRFPLFADLNRDELLHVSDLAREVADDIAVSEKARAV